LLAQGVVLSKSTLFGIVVGIVTGGLILIAGFLFVRYYLFTGDERDPRFQKRSCLFCNRPIAPASAFDDVMQFWTRPSGDLRRPLLISRAHGAADA
jgi:hypothetical protein